MKALAHLETVMKEVALEMGFPFEGEINPDHLKKIMEDDRVKAVCDKIDDEIHNK